MEKSLLEANSKEDMPLATFAFLEWAKELLAHAEFLYPTLWVKSQINVCIQHTD